MNSKRPAGLSQIAEIAAAVGVIVSLVFVGIELRQNTIASRASTAQAIIDSSRNFLLEVASDDEMSRIRKNGESDLSSLDEFEEYRFGTYSRGNWLYFHNVWIQWNLGVVDDRIWNSMYSIICEIQSSEGNAEEWKSHKHVLDREFVDLVESCPKT